MVAEDKTAIVLPRSIKKYKKENGKYPFDQWRKKHTNSNVGAAIDHALDRIEEGKTVKVKSYDGNVAAIVLSWPRKIRIYYGVDADNTIILLGGDESGQSKDIANAKIYWKDYLKSEN